MGAFLDRQKKDHCKLFFLRRMMSLVFSDDVPDVSGRAEGSHCLVTSSPFQASCDGQQSVSQVLSSY